MLSETTSQTTVLPASARKFALSDILGILLLFIPWSYYSGSTKIVLENGSTTIVNTKVWQFWFGRIIMTENAGYTGTQFRFFGFGGDPLFSIFTFIALLLYVDAMIHRVIKFYRKQPVGGRYGSDMIISALILLLSVTGFTMDKSGFIPRIHRTTPLYTREIHAIAFERVGLNWGFNTDATSIDFGITPATLILFIIAIIELRKLSFEWWNSLVAKIRFSFLGLFTLISIFPLVWVFIVSVNTQRLIRSGQPLWPLDLSRSPSFDSYRRFFIIEGNIAYAGVLFILVVLTIVILYHQISRAGAWLDRIQGIIYSINPRKATNNNTTIIYWLAMLFNLILSTIILRLIFSINPVLGIPGAGLQWYLQLAEEAGGERFPVGNWFYITFIISAGVSVFGLIMSALAAYAMSRFDFPGKSSVLTVILSTQMFPGIILLLPLLVMWKAMELTDSIFGLTLAYATFAVPFATFMLKGYFDSIPQDLEEAAMVDGCTRMGAFTRVILPLSLPGLASTFLFTFLTGYTEYLLALTLYNGDKENYTISLALINVFRTDFQNYYYPDLALFSIIVAMPILLLFVYLQRFLVAGLVAGGTKG